MQAATELALSSAAREKGDYRTALKHAQQALTWNPEIASTQFAVGTLAKGMCIPNAQPGPNMRECNLAIEEYERVLQIDGSHKEAAKDLAFLLWQFNRQESEGYYRKALALDPNDPEALAALGALDATRSWCSEVRENNLARVNQGTSLLIKASRI